MSKVEIGYEQNNHQREFHTDLESKFLHLSCGFGGGKSFGLAMKGFQLSYLNRNITGGCVVPSIAEYKKDLLPIFHEILESNRVRYRYHHTDKWFRFPWSKGTLQIATAERAIRGPNWGFCLFNELGQIEHARYKEGIGRVRVKGAPCPQVASSGTPEGTGHWIYEEFVDKPMKGSRIIYGDTRDNIKNLSQDYIDSLESSYDSIMLDAYLRGMFINMSASRFYYAYDPKRNLDKEICQIDGETIHVCMDFNVDPMTATLCHILPVTNASGLPLYDPYGQPLKRITAWGQIELGGTQGADTKKMAQALLSRGCHPDITIIYPDPAGNSRRTSGSSDVAILRQHGFTQIKFKNVAPMFRRRQLAVNNLLEKGLILIHPDAAKGLKRDLEAVEQDQVTLGKVKDNPKLTHFSDGLDYMVDVEFPLSGSKPDSRMNRIR